MRPFTIIICLFILSAAWFVVGMEFEKWRQQKKVENSFIIQRAIQKLHTTEFKTQQPLPSQTDLLDRR